jgi:hypothetical protein
MWNVNELFDAATLEALPSKGFQVSSTRGVVRVEKYGCGAEFRRVPKGRFQMTIMPSIVHDGNFTRLWDAGYQKFLITDEGQKLPATAQRLESLRKFNEELRYALGVPTYYNEALGSTSQVTEYDRVHGRPGAVPDSSVGVKASGESH